MNILLNHNLGPFRTFYVLHLEDQGQCLCHIYPHNLSIQSCKCSLQLLACFTFTTDILSAGASFIDNLTLPFFFKNNRKIILSSSLTEVRRVFTLILPTVFFSTHRKREILLEVYKAVYKLSPPFMWELFKMKETKYNFRQNIQVHLKYCNSKTRTESLVYYCSSLWNKLSNKVKKYDFKEFKNFFNTWFEPSCKCKHVNTKLKYQINCNWCLW